MKKKTKEKKKNHKICYSRALLSLNIHPDISRTNYFTPHTKTTIDIDTVH